MKRNVTTLGLALVMTLATSTAVRVYANTQAPECSQSITIVHTNDMHGRIVSSDTIIGIDTIAAIYNATPNALLIDAGDAFHGLPFVTFNQGMNAIELMNAAGYSLFVPGNHDFNYGSDWLLHLESLAEFDFIASNLVYEESGESMFDEISVQEINGVTVGFFGLAFPGTPTVTNPVNVIGLDFTNPVEAARRSVETLQAMDVDVIIAIAHLGVDGEAWGRVVAEEVPAIDVVIDGHSHTLFEEGLWVNDVLVAQAGAHGQYVGKIDITVLDGQVISKSASVIDKEAALNFVPNAQMQEEINQLDGDLSEILDEVVGSIPVTLFGDSPEHRLTLRSSEVAIGNLVADSMRWELGADIAIANSGNIRSHLFEGEITKGDVLRVLSFFNFNVMLEVTPALLFDALENGVSAMPGNGRFPQVSGFSFVFDESAPEGERVLTVIMGGEELDRNDTTTTLTLVTSDFVAVGGDGYEMFIDLPVLAQGGTQDEVLILYLDAHDVSDIAIEGRSINVSENPTIAPVFTEPNMMLDTALSNAPVVLTFDGNTYNYFGMNVFVRSTPSFTGEIINVLAAGDDVNLLRKVNGFTEIETADGTGWVQTRFVKALVQE